MDGVFRDLAVLLLPVAGGVLGYMNAWEDLTGAPPSFRRALGGVLRHIAREFGLGAGDGR